MEQILKKYRGSIFNLKVKGKKHNGVILEQIEGYDCFLHVNHISSDFKRGSALLDLLNIGDSIDVVLIQINQNFGSFDVSTRVFEEQNSIIDYEQCREIVSERLQRRLTRDDEDLKEYRSILNRLLSDLNREGETFAFELLQNADDYPNDIYENKVRITFEVKENYLLIKHDGRPFNESNVKSICSILLSDQERIGDETRIGYKGIGFKSVFHYTQWVYIHSGNFSFRFDKTAELFQKHVSKDNLPWEVMPINTEEIEILKQINDYEFFNKPVGFAMKIEDRDSEKIVTTLKSLIENPTVILFLKHIRQINFKFDNLNHNLQIKNKINIYGDSKNIRFQDILQNGKNYTFCIYNDSFEIDDIEVIEELQKDEIPERFRHFRNPNITYAVEYSNNKLANKSIPYDFFFYLPLKETNFGFSFYVNADFIPDLDRTKPLENLKYNKLIMYYIGNYFVDLLEKLSDYSSEIRKKVLNLIPANESRDEILIKEFWKGFDGSILEKKLFYGIDKKKISLSEILYDKENFIEEVLGDEYEKFFPNLQLLGKDYEGYSKIERLIKRYEVGNIFNNESIIEFFRDEEFKKWLKNTSNNCRFLKYLLKSSTFDIEDVLKRESLILTDCKRLKNFDCVYKTIPKELSFLDLYQIDRGLLKLLNAEELSINLKEFNPKDFYNKHIVENYTYLNERLANEISNINFWNFIYDNWDSLKNEQSISKSLKNIIVICKPINEGELLINSIQSTYISKEYTPEKEIESVINKLPIDSVFFISEKYIQDERRDIDKWCNLFEKANAITDLQKVLNVLIPQIKNIDNTKHFEITLQVFRNWKKSKIISDEHKKLLRDNLTLKCVKGENLYSSQCIISDHFNNNSLIKDTLPVIELNCLISQDYDSKQSQIADWKKFFIEVLGIRELSQKQDVIDEKVYYFIENQNNSEIISKHYEIITVLSDLFKSRYTNKYNFERQGFSQIKIQDDSGHWLLPSNLHLTSTYTPKLDLQKEEGLDLNINFISDDYYNKGINKDFLIFIGVNEGFKFIKSDIGRNLIPITFLREFEEVDAYIKQNAYSYSHQHRLLNHITLNYTELLKDIKYSTVFWAYVSENEASFVSHFFQKSQYKCAFHTKSYENYVVHYVKNNEAFPTQTNTLSTTKELYSSKLGDYISNKENLPKYDLSDIRNPDGEKTLEELIGINTLLSINHCIELLCRSKEQLSIKEIQELDLVNILLNYKPNEEEKECILLLNQDEEWKKVSELCIKNDDIVEVESSRILHDIFLPLKDEFGIPELSVDKLILKTIPENPSVSLNIVTRFKERAKYLAYKINQEQYKEIESEILATIDELDFFEVDCIERVFDNTNFSKFKIEESHFIDYKNNKVYYKDYWMQNSKVLSYIYGLLDYDNLKKPWFDNAILRWDIEDICKNLEDEFGDLPEYVKPVMNNDKLYENELSNKEYLNEVLSFIDSMQEVEDLYDEDKIEDLKSILESFKDHPQERRNSLNLLAKLKLCKKLSIEYNDDWEFNQVVNANHKYFIHSARGAFAYIHPHELIQMKENGFKMAIDYGMRDIRVYNSYMEIIELYQNYLMLYQGNPTPDEIIRLCEENQMAQKFHFLIVDREKETEEAKTILKILNIENYE